MRKLKFAGVAKFGEKIRALDFAFSENTYIEGTVLEESAAHPEQGVPCYKILVTRDVQDGQDYAGKGCRVGSTGWVPHEIAFMEGDTRITKLPGGFADKGSTEPTKREPREE